MKLKTPQAIRWTGSELFLLDQTKLPGEVVEEKQETIEMVWESIKQLKVRGAPAIGVSAAFGLLIGIKDSLHLSIAEFLSLIKKQATYLDSSRPTAVNLHWSMERMVAKASSTEAKSSKELFEGLVKEAVAIDTEDKQLCLGMGEHGAPLIKEGMGILTHCNAGSLATAGIGTALAPMYIAAKKGVSFKVFVDETRPLLQGARLTSWELQQAEIDATLITDSMAGYMMSLGAIDMVITGTDRVAANGDVANKIGTMSVAILADYFAIPFYVACPSSTIDFSTPTGEMIEIEERGSDEVCFFGEKRTAPLNMKTRNPAFDVTPNHLVKGLITEKGVVTTPFKKNLRKLFPNHQSA